MDFLLLKLRRVVESYGYQSLRFKRTYDTESNREKKEKKKKKRSRAIIVIFPGKYPFYFLNPL